MRKYPKMTYRPELWRRKCKNSSKVFGFQFLGANFQISQPGWYPDRAIKILHIMENFYCLVRLSAWLWNLEIAPKNLNPKTLRLFSHVLCHIILIDTSFWCNFSHLWTTFSHFWCAFSVFCGQAEIKQTPNPPIKIRHMEIFFGGYFKFVWLKTSKIAHLAYLHAKLWPQGIIFALSGCFDVMSDDFKGVWVKKATKKLLFSSYVTPKNLFHIFMPKIFEVCGISITCDTFLMPIFRKSAMQEHREVWDTKVLLCENLKKHTTHTHTHTAFCLGCTSLEVYGQFIPAPCLLEYHCINDIPSTKYHGTNCK